jgi:hypothetical protein
MWSSPLSGSGRPFLLLSCSLRQPWWFTIPSIGTLLFFSMIVGTLCRVGVQARYCNGASDLLRAEGGCRVEAKVKLAFALCSVCDR